MGATNYNVYSQIEYDSSRSAKAMQQCLSLFYNTRKMLLKYERGETMYTVQDLTDFLAAQKRCTTIYGDSTDALVA